MKTTKTLLIKKVKITTVLLLFLIINSSCENKGSDEIILEDNNSNYSFSKLSFNDFIKVIPQNNQQTSKIIALFENNQFAKKK